LVLGEGHAAFCFGYVGTNSAAVHGPPRIKVETEASRDRDTAAEPLCQKLYFLRSVSSSQWIIEQSVQTLSTMIVEFSKP